MRMFKELRVVMNCIVGGIRSFIWVFLLLLIMKYACGIMFIQGVVQFLETKPQFGDAIGIREDEYLSALVTEWGTVANAMLSLYKPVSGGGPWGKTADRLWPVGKIYYTVFILYLAFIVFAVLKL